MNENDARNAIDRVAQRIRQHSRDPKMTHTDAQKQARKIANRVDRKYPENHRK